MGLLLLARSVGGGNLIHCIKCRMCGYCFYFFREVTLVTELSRMGCDHGRKPGLYLAFFPLFCWHCHTGVIAFDFESMEVLSLTSSSSGFSF